MRASEVLLVPPYEVASFDPQGDFVYVLWGDDPDQPLYVGRSSNVLARLGFHMAAPYASRVRRVTLTRCAGVRNSELLERRLIRRYHPELNVMLQRNGQ